MTYDVGDVVTTPELEVFIFDDTGTAADATTVTVTITLPDGTTSSPSVTHAGTGHYTASYTVTQAGLHDVDWVATGTNASAYSTSFEVRAATEALIPLADAKARLSINTDTSDDLLRTYIDAVGAAVESYTGRTFRRQTFTEVYDGGYPAISLLHLPVISVSSVSESGTALGVTDYTINGLRGVLWRGASSYYPGRFAPGIQNISVTYVAGYVDIPDDVMHAAKQMLSHLWETQRGSMGLNRGPTSDDYIGVAGYSFPRRVVELLNPYVVPGIA